MIKITSVNNPLIKERSLLKNAQDRRSQALFLIEGYHLINEAKDKNIIKELFITKENDYLAGVDNYLVSEDVIKKLSQTINPQNIVAVCSPKEMNFDYEKPFLLLDGLSDPGNMGTILRLALGFGRSNIIISETSVDIYNDKVIRASGGAIFKVNIKRSNLLQEASLLKEKGFFLYGADNKAKSDLTKIKIKTPNALVLGSESLGISQELSHYLDELIVIKTNKELESLNVSVAGGIILHHFYNVEK